MGLAMQSDHRFRVADAADVADVVRFVNETYHGKDAPGGWTPETHLHAGPRTSTTEVAAAIADPDRRLLLCETATGLVGCVLLERHGADCHLGMFAVLTAQQGAGWGKAILAEAERRAVALWRCRAATMSVINLQTKLIEYYERRGYRRTGERAPFPFDEAPGALRRDYDLVVVRKPLPEG